MDDCDRIQQRLEAAGNPEKAAFLPRFFRAQPGGYGEGDQFLGVSVPNQRRIAKEFKQTERPQLKRLLESNIHEHRFTALVILTLQYQGASSDSTRERVFQFYCQHRDRVNNWDLVDATAHKIVGPHLEDRDRSLLYKWANSPVLWDRRIAMIATFHFIRKEEFEDTIRLATQFLNDPEDLMAKATGWMLREIGKRNEARLREFLDQWTPQMPRTMLRYAIEKLDEPTRQAYLSIKPNGAAEATLRP